LISNALQYTPSKGQVSVQLSRLEGSNRGSKLRHGTAVLQIKVTDTGIGIPSEALPRLFDRFYRVDPARTHKTAKTNTETSTGSGLGLAIASAIVEHHQGHLQVESNIGKGTTFTVTLPIILMNHHS
jgi:OmpR-family two-component system manganese-sensing sensor histidine kinase